MRTGKLTAEDVSKIHKLERSVVYEDGLEPSELYPLRRQVADCNEARLRALHPPIWAYRGMDYSGYDARKHPISFETAKRLLDDLIAPELLELKVGAQVMLLVNVEQGTLVNGSVGKVTHFMTLLEARSKNIPITEIRVPEIDPKLPLTSMTTHVFPQNQAWPVVEFAGGRPLLCPALCFEPGLYQYTNHKVKPCSAFGWIWVGYLKKDRHMLPYRVLQVWNIFKSCTLTL
ncbi:hypothetical protein BDN72DRAFT_6898 [Pluteus cervinus]|uniref:Uncharacterized protein n=1 Tax=Pluteus cervinus TaxID=181527 RepID=A0ACD3BGG2_9AGAR|nr:hypothetical protein BDN72DRAFT_6898 [Pluteus cervinus]